MLTEELAAILLHHPGKRVMIQYTDHTDWTYNMDIIESQIETGTVLDDDNNVKHQVLILNADEENGTEDIIEI